MAKELEMKQISGSAVSNLNHILADILRDTDLATAKERALAAIYLIDGECTDQTGRITSFQLGPDAEKDSVSTETLLMKLAMAESVINDMGRYIEATETNDGTRPDGVEAPDTWAHCGLYLNLHEVSHALKAGCWGYKDALRQ